VLELDLEQAHELDGDAGGPGDADAGVLVGGEHLLDRALGDDVAHRRPAVPGHHDAVGPRGRHDGGPVRGLDRAGSGGAQVSQQVRAVLGEELGEGGLPDHREGRRHGAVGHLLAALLDEAAHELLGVLLEHVVDLVEQGVDVGIEGLLAR
jgi:hypothetical protein